MWSFQFKKNIYLQEAEEVIRIEPTSLIHSKFRIVVDGVKVGDYESQGRRLASIHINGMFWKCCSCDDESDIFHLKNKQNVTVAVAKRLGLIFKRIEVQYGEGIYVVKGGAFAKQHYRISKNKECFGEIRPNFHVLRTMLINVPKDTPPHLAVFLHWLCRDCLRTDFPLIVIPPV